MVKQAPTNQPRRSVALSTKKLTALNENLAINGANGYNSKGGSRASSVMSVQPSVTKSTKRNPHPGNMIPKRKRNFDYDVIKEKKEKRQRFLKESMVRHEQGSKDAKAGSLFSLGQGDTGQLGLGEDIMERKKPSLVRGVEGKVVAVAAGGMHTVCLTSNGAVWSFGCNDEGALGRHIDEDEEG